MYKIVRMYRRPDPSSPSGHLQTKKHTITTGLTLEEAQAHCRRDDTCTTGKGTAKKARGGWDWADGYTET